METILYIGALFASLVLIWKAGGVFVDSACAMARGLGVSRAVIALTLVAFATSAPEFFASTIAAWLGHPEVEIAYGNVVGSNIINITPILAIAAVLGATLVDRERLKEGGIMLAIGGVLVAMALHNHQIDRWEGLVLILIFVLFLGFVFKRERKRARGKTASRTGLVKFTLLFALSAVGVILGARLLIYSAVGIASILRVPEAAMGFTLVALGTSIPELAAVVIASFKQLPEFSVGTIIGSNIFNSALVAGCAASIRPLAVDSKALWFSNPMMLAAMVVLLAFMWTGMQLSRREGIAMLGFYAFYLGGLACLYAPQVI